MAGLGCTGKRNGPVPSKWANGPIGDTPDLVVIVSL